MGDDDMSTEQQPISVKHLTIVLIKGPYVSEAADMACKTALKAKQKGYVVHLFLYLDGVWNAHLTGDKTYNNPGDWLRRVLRKHVEAMACERCSQARDLTESNIIDGIHIPGSSKLIDFLVESDVVLVFGG
jgi:sulfur relay (sulfurtransferase) complex TusBCD TusD component (DsrE family)